MSRKLCTLLVACAFALCSTGLAWAGSYLDRAALMMNESGHACHLLRARLGDKEFARVVHELSRARMDAASHMQIPKEVAVAHPHLLLVLESYERASDAAEHGEAQRFLVHLQKATEEERIFHSVIEQMGWSLPKL